MIRRILLSLAVPTLFAVTGCSGGDATEPGSSDDELGGERIALKDYALTAGIVGMGPEARKLYADMKASGAKDVGEGVLVAGLNGRELGLTDPDDAKENFGISCTPAEADHTFRQDTCALSAIVKTEGQDKRGEGSYVITVTGKLAKAIAISLPRTSPAGLVGTMTTGSGKIACRTGAGPVASSCTIPIAGVLSTLEEAVNDTQSDSRMSAADARKLVKAFF